MDYIAHRSYKYIKKVRTKSGKWRYIYARPHGRSLANTRSNYNDINWSETRNGYTYTHGDKALREMYPWRYKTYEVPADSHNAENSRKRRIAAQTSAEGRRKEQMAERKTNKNTEKFLNTLYKMPLGWLFKAYVEISKKKK